MPLARKNIVFFFFSPSITHAVRTKKFGQLACKPCSSPFFKNPKTSFLGCLVASPRLTEKKRRKVGEKILSPKSCPFCALHALTRCFLGSLHLMVFECMHSQSFFVRVSFGGRHISIGWWPKPYRRHSICCNRFKHWRFLSLPCVQRISSQDNLKCSIRASKEQSKKTAILKCLAYIFSRYYHGMGLVTNNWQSIIVFAFSSRGQAEEVLSFGLTDAHNWTSHCFCTNAHTHTIAARSSFGDTLAIEAWSPNGILLSRITLSFYFSSLKKGRGFVINIQMCLQQRNCTE